MQNLDNNINLPPIRGSGEKIKKKENKAKASESPYNKIHVFS